MHKTCIALLLGLALASPHGAAPAQAESGRTYGTRGSTAGEGDRVWSTRQLREDPGAPGEPGVWRTPRWEIGDVVPETYRQPRYAVRNWGGLGLEEPPDDHEWISVDTDYFLVHVGNGVVVRVRMGGAR